MVCGVGEFGVGNPDLGNPAVDGGKDGGEEAARGGTRLVRVVRYYAPKRRRRGRKDKTRPKTEESRTTRSNDF